MKNTITDKELSNAAGNLLEKLDNTTDEEALHQLENCEPGVFTEMVEDGFILPGMEDFNNE